MTMFALGGGLAGWAIILLLIGWPDMAALAVTAGLAAFLLGTIAA